MPEIVDSETFKKRAEESPVGIIYRGVFAKTQTEAERFVVAFKTGELFTGRKQAYGHGIYFSPVEGDCSEICTVRRDDQKLRCTETQR